MVRDPALAADATPGALPPYPARVASLLARRIALWDVCQSAERPGSLDASIVTSSVAANDFAGFFRAHPAIRCVLFNGQTAHALYRRLVLPALDLPAPLPDLVVLPSTSPAHASLPLAEKVRRWRAALGR